MNNGAFQVSRSIYDSDVWNKPAEWLKIWIYILGIVNYGDTSQFKRGENYFTFDEIGRVCKTNYNTVNKCIVFLRKAKQIETQKTTRGVIIKVLNYNEYQTLDNYEAKQKQDKSKIEAKQKQDKSNTIKEETKKQRNKEINNTINKPTKIKIFEADSFEYKISKFFLNFHVNYQTPSIGFLLKEKSEDLIIQKWSDEIRKLKSIDKFTEEQIEFIIKFTTQDIFWRDQILSIEKFRKKKDGVSYFVKMIDKAKSNMNTKKSNVIPDGESF